MIFLLPLCGVEAAVGWLQSLQMPAFLDPRIPTGLQRTCTKYTVPGRNPASLQEVWFPTSSTTCRERYPKQSVTSNTYSGRIPHTHTRTVTLTGIFNVLYKKKNKAIHFQILKQVHTSPFTKKKNKEISPFLCSWGIYQRISEKKTGGKWQGYTHK